MSYTAQTLVHEGDWDSNSDKHPAAKWMHMYTDKVDQGFTDELYNAHVDPSFVYSKADGQIFPAGKPSWEQVRADYSLFTSWHHEPYFLVTWEREDGSAYELIGNAWLYVNLPGDGERTLKDKKGQSWEMRVPGGFHFVYLKKDEDLKIATTAITSDSGPIVVEALKRGILKPQDIGL